MLLLSIQQLMLYAVKKEILGVSTVVRSLERVTDYLFWNIRGCGQHS